MQHSTSDHIIGSPRPNLFFQPRSRETPRGQPPAVTPEGNILPSTTLKDWRRASDFGRRINPFLHGPSSTTSPPPTPRSSIHAPKSISNPTPSPPTTPLPHIRYRLAFQARNGCAMLHVLELTEHDLGPEEVMRKLRVKAKEIMPPSRLAWVWKVMIETAVIEPINGPDLERHIPLAINLRGNTPNPWLRQAFHNPEVLDHAPDFTEFKIGENNGTPLKTLVIRTAINKARMLYLLLFAAVFACAIGILSGAVTRRVDLGFGVAGAVFALITVVQGVVVTFMRELGGGGRGG
ncbi:hypothetical protein K440DRAFT_660793 [Wilcoxina mikolae CBS 423.85]|nr:hypothetical protein K440DRAFT_660793 [Wilcoxina mikolae CBS 423.85]